MAQPPRSFHSLPPEGAAPVLGAARRTASAAARIISERAMRAGKSPNQVVMDAALEAMTEACRLANEGHTIVALYVTRDGKPSIQLERSHYLAELVETGKAIYCAFGIGTNGQRRRKGELLGRPCRVTWLEVGQ